MISDILDSIIEVGRRLLSSQPTEVPVGASTLEGMCSRVLSRRGEATALAAASELVSRLERSETVEKEAFFRILIDRFAVDREAVLSAADAYREQNDWQSLQRLAHAVEPPRQELLRRLNMAPGGTEMIVRLREYLLQRLPDNPALRPVDADFLHLLNSWFNRGFLFLRRIDWNSPAALLEKVKRYEAVHEIIDWSDLRRRLDLDRRCFGFFHPSLEDEPLIFIEVALGQELHGSIQRILDQSVVPVEPAAATHAIFFSINNCQVGLRGVSFGHFLIKQVVVELQREFPKLRVFSTLSPIPSFCSWLKAALKNGQLSSLSPGTAAGLAQLLESETWSIDDLEPYREVLLALCARYLSGRATDGRQLDPVAKFHLGNGARLERLNWKGDLSHKGLRQSFGILVNYFYELESLELNHEAFVTEGRIALSKDMTKLRDGKLEASGTDRR